MAVKAPIIAQTHSAPPRTHAVDDLLRQLGAGADLVDAGRGLARGYLVWRYPGIVGQPPHEMVRESDAAACVAHAGRILEWVRTLLPEP